MIPVFEAGGVRLFHGDCIEVLRELPDASVHAIVTDPPYGIAFMGKQWDQPGEFGSTRRKGTPNPYRRGPNREQRLIGDGAMAAGLYDLSPAALTRFQRWCEVWATECLRVLKPGGHMLVSGSPRTWHRLASGIEDAGFEIRDSIAWLFGSGFPKSLDVSKAIDGLHLRGRSDSLALASVNAERPGEATIRPASTNGHSGFVGSGDAGPREKRAEPATEEARAWQGWGTALKPAFEPIVVARKPLDGTVAGNVLEHGTGALNIAATRIGTDDDLGGGAYAAEGGRSVSGSLNPSGMNRPGATVGREFEQPSGRWPTNVVLDESQGAELDGQTGILTSGANPARRGSDKFRNAYGEFKGQAEIEPVRGAESGGASRFFPTFRYEAKAPKSERPEQGGVQHPTVKPLDLMRWLVRLITPPGGTVLDLFAGSGTTLEAAVREGFAAIGIEREADYIPLIIQRLQRQPDVVADLMERGEHVAPEDGGLW